MKTALVWFKTDLRLRDNETLLRAVKENDQIIPLFCLDEAMFAVSAFGFKKMGAFRAKFLLESIKNLDEQLRQLGSGLILLRGNTPQVILDLVEQYQVKQVYTKKEVAYEEIELVNQVEQLLWKRGCSLEVYSTSTLYRAEDLPFTIKDIPDIFSNFRHAVEAESSVRDEFDSVSKIHSPEIPALELPTLQSLGLDDIQPDSRTAFPFEGGETSGLKRLQDYLESGKVNSYKETRNGMIGENYSSKLSSWLSMGCLSPKTVYHELKKYEKQNGANDSTYWLYFELLWRDYFRFMMKKHHTAFFKRFGFSGKDDGIRKPMDKKKLNQWIHGETGNDFIDANMRELQSTGFMSNRGRQNVASYLCNDLHLDWRYGAAYFEEMLIDYDVCSNWGNWAYIAGVGNDPRKDRYFNIEKQALTYDRDKSYRKLWLDSI